MKNVPWYIQDDKDNLLDYLENKTKTKKTCKKLKHQIKTRSC